jgi:hypothetical protein
MGNIISDPNDNYLLANTQLRKIVEDWALNDYDAGLGYRRTDIYNNQLVVKNVLRKRACCTRNTVMNIALPIVDINSINNPIKTGYQPIKIRVFEDGALDKDNPVECNFVDESQPGDKDSRGNYRKVSYLQKILQLNQGANAKCSSLYEDGGTNLGLCTKIKLERQVIYNKPSQNAYGYYASNEQIIKDNSLDSYNNYTDCNCKNSILRDIILPTIAGYDNINSRETFVQSNDSYCSKCSAAGTCYISSSQRVSSLCINISEIQNSIADSSSNLQNIQSCNMSNTVNTPNSDTSAPSTGEDWISQFLTPTSQSTDGNAQASTSKQPTTSSSMDSNTKNIIIGLSVVAGLIIIGLIIFIIYKKNKTHRKIKKRGSRKGSISLRRQSQ